ncbi:hypothetical protein CAP35_08600 [Chitinophagaceae bacterium IBVUCB1]|nr:hypothetical protein CAP35_08600 [Chitinophagaceae bacterium IBVUCB1]
MKLKSKWILTVVCMAATFSLIAQSQNKDGKGGDDKAKTKPKPKPIPVYLGKSNRDGGLMPYRQFNELVAQGLTSKDSAGKVFTVTSFMLNYGERNLYEDSVGNPLIVTDYMAQMCEGDTLATFLKNSLTERTKPGDTVYFEMIYVKAPEGYAAHGKTMKFVLTK